MERQIKILTLHLIFNLSTLISKNYLFYKGLIRIMHIISAQVVYIMIKTLGRVIYSTKMQKILCRYHFRMSRDKIEFIMPMRWPYSQNNLLDFKWKIAQRIKIIFSPHSKIWLKNKTIRSKKICIYQ